MLGPAALLTSLLLAPPAVPRVIGASESAEVISSGQAQTSLRLAPQGMLVLEIEGPLELGLGLRGLSPRGVRPVPLDLTVVRDDVEQGTVRIALPPPDGAVLPADDALEPSGEVLARIDVPPGPHSYRIVIGGPSRGALVRPFSAKRLAPGAIVATPGASAAAAPVRPAPPRSPVRSPPRTLASEVETVDGSLSPWHRPDAVRIPRVVRREPGLTPWTLTGLSLTGSLAFAGVAVLVSGRVQAERAHDEPIQIQAGALHDSSERSYRTGAALLGTAAALGLATVIAWWLETPASPGAARLEFRF
ncbi:MAG: hypothetical protein GYA21_08670 [Myxococcales bacterium]|nr:hypothetical protein [Myxococcales bacterium]